MTASTVSTTAGASVDESVGSGSWMYRKMPRGVLFIVMLFTGVASLIHEFVFATVFTYLLGSSIEQWSITLGLMFAAMGVGTALQRSIKVHLVEAFLMIELVLVLMGGFAPIVLQWALATVPDDFGWIKFIYTVVPGVAIGMEIPLIMRINEKYFSRSLGQNISETWSWDYVGGAVGVAGWIILLRSGVPIVHISFIVAAFNMAVALLALGFFWKRGLLQRSFNGFMLTTLSIATLVAVLYGSTQANAWSAMVGQKLYDDPIEVAFTTKYQNIVLTRGKHPSNPEDHNWQLWLNGNKQFSSVDEAIYHEYLVHPVMNLSAQHEDVLILGGGDGMALREVLKYKGVKSVTLVDLDEGMIEFARDNPVMADLNKGSFNDARVSATVSEGVVDTGDKQDVLVETGGPNEVACREVADGATESLCSSKPETEKVATVDIFTIDADRFVSGHPGLYDVVIVDLPDPSSVELAKLYSVEFYAKIKRLLSPSGMAVVQSTSPYHAKETYLAIMRSMTAAGLNTLPYHDNVPSFGDWGWILGSPKLPQEVLYQRAESLSSFGVKTEEVEASNMQRALIFNRGWLESDRTDVSTLMDPSVFQYYVFDAWKTD